MGYEMHIIWGCIDSSIMAQATGIKLRNGKIKIIKSPIKS